MGYLAIVDGFLQLKPVRWGLLAAALLLALFLALYVLRLKANERALEISRAEAAESRAFLSVQNAAVLDLQAKGEKARAQVEAAVAEAERERERYSALAESIMERPAPVDCEEARAFGLALAKELGRMK